MKTRKIIFLTTPFILLVSAILYFHFRKDNTQISRTVEVREVNGKYSLYRNGEPYYIIGGGGVSHFEELKDIGGNSIRTWSLHNAQEILDEAEKNGLTVTLGIEIGNQPWGEDFSYWNVKETNKKIEEIREIVLKYKDHPALLIWGIGNEVHLFGGNRVLVSLFINRVAKMIHEIDPNHPVMTTTTAGINLDKYGFMRVLCPHLDILGINAFDRLHLVENEISGPLGWNKPYIITEFGVRGPWETQDTEWGAPIEMSSTENAQFIKHYWEIIRNDKRYGLGGYAFYWGHKFEVTNTWFSLFSKNGKKSETIDLLQESWTGKKPEHHAPKIDKLMIWDIVQKQSIYLDASNTYEVEIMVTHDHKDSLSYEWEIRADGESAHVQSRHDYIYDYLLETDQNKSKISFTTPKTEGGYRIFAFVYDKNGRFATANLPFYVVKNKI